MPSRFLVGDGAPSTNIGSTAAFYSSLGELSSVVSSNPKKHVAYLLLFVELGGSGHDSVVIDALASYACDAAVLFVRVGPIVFILNFPVLGDAQAQVFRLFSTGSRALFFFIIVIFILILCRGGICPSLLFFFGFLSFLDIFLVVVIINFLFVFPLTRAFSPPSARSMSGAVFLESNCSGSWASSRSTTGCGLRAASYAGG